MFRQSTQPGRPKSSRETPLEPLRPTTWLRYESEGGGYLFVNQQTGEESDVPPAEGWTPAANEAFPNNEVGLGGSSTDGSGENDRPLDGAVLSVDATIPAYSPQVGITVGPADFGSAPTFGPTSSAIQVKEAMVEGETFGQDFAPMMMGMGLDPTGEEWQRCVDGTMKAEECTRDVVAFLPLPAQKAFVLKAFGSMAMHILVVFWWVYICEALQYNGYVHAVLSVTAQQSIAIVLLLTYIVLMFMMFLDVKNEIRSDPDDDEPGCMVPWFIAYFVLELLCLGSLTWFGRSGFVTQCVFWHFLCTLFTALFMQLNEPACISDFQERPMNAMLAGVLGWLTMVVCALFIFYSWPGLLWMEEGKISKQVFAASLVVIFFVQMAQTIPYETHLSRRLHEDEWLYCMIMLHSHVAVVVVSMCACCCGPVLLMGGGAAVEGAAGAIEGK